MTPTQLADIEARAKAATEGPWCVHRNNGNRPSDRTRRVQLCASGGCGPLATIHVPYGRDDGSYEKREGNAQFIVHARQDIPDLIAHIRELESQNKDLVNRLADFTSGDYT